MSHRNAWAPIVGAALISSLLTSLALAIAFGPKFLSEFLIGPAAGWAQAIGSVAAIGVAYWLGQDSHRQQILRDMRAETLKLTLTARAISELLQLAHALDRLVIDFCETKAESWRLVDELAEDQLEGVMNFPPTSAVELPLAA